jgi:hypothetical protein
VALSRKGNELVFDIHQTDPKRVRTIGISHLFEWFVQASSNVSGPQYNELFDGPIDFQPLLPPPPLPPNP